MRNEKNITEEYAQELIRYGDSLEPEKLLLIGYCYYLGIGTERNHEEACKFYGMSALMGNAEAQYRLGSCYEWGNGIPEDRQMAFFWYNKSSDRNYLRGRIRLAQLFFKGSGCTRDQEEGFRLLLSAAEAGCDEAYMELAGKYYDGSPTRAPDRKKAKFWARKALNPRYSKNEDDFDLWDPEEAECSDDEAEDALKFWDWSD